VIRVAIATCALVLAIAAEAFPQNSVGPVIVVDTTKGTFSFAP